MSAAKAVGARKQRAVEQQAAAAATLYSR